MSTFCVAPGGKIYLQLTEEATEPCGVLSRAVNCRTDIWLLACLSPDPMILHTHTYTRACTALKTLSRCHSELLLSTRRSLYQDHAMKPCQRRASFLEEKHPIFLPRGASLPSVGHTDGQRVHFSGLWFRTWLHAWIPHLNWHRGSPFSPSLPPSHSESHGVGPKNLFLCVSEVVLSGKVLAPSAQEGWTTPNVVPAMLWMERLGEHLPLPCTRSSWTPHAALVTPHVRAWCQSSVLDKPGRAPRAGLVSVCKHKGDAVSHMLHTCAHTPFWSRGCFVSLFSLVEIGLPSTLTLWQQLGPRCRPVFINSTATVGAVEGSESHKQTRLLLSRESNISTLKEE